MSLHTIVCVKVVPKPEEVKVDPVTNTLDRGKARSEINPPDMNALEVALAFKQQHGGMVSVLSMGPPFVVPVLRAALGMGADHIYLLSDRAFGAADTLATSYTLAKGIERIGPFDLVLCGEESSDGATAQVPPGIAEWLDLPQVTYATALQVDDQEVVARREIRGGHEMIAAPLPAVASITSSANEPRFLDLEQRSWLDDPALVTVWTAADLEANPEMLGLSGSGTTVAGVRAAPAAERKREMLSGSPEEAAELLFERIREYLVSSPRPADEDRSQTTARAGPAEEAEPVSEGDMLTAQMELESVGTCATCHQMPSAGGSVTQLEKSTVLLQQFWYHPSCAPSCQTCGRQLKALEDEWWVYQAEVVSAPWGYWVNPTAYWCQDCWDMVLRDEPPALD